jgi:cytochrome P450 family 28
MILYLILGVILLVYVWLTWNFDYWSKRGVPAAKARVLLGSLPNMVLRKENIKYDFDRIYK